MSGQLCGGASKKRNRNQQKKETDAQQSEAERLRQQEQDEVMTEWSDDAATQKLQEWRPERFVAITSEHYDGDGTDRQVPAGCDYEKSNRNDEDREEGAGTICW